MHLDFVRPSHYSDPFTDVVRYRMKSLERPTMTISAGQLGSGKSFSQLSAGESCDFNGWVKEIQNGQKFSEVSPSLLLISYHCSKCGYDSKMETFEKVLLDFGRKIRQLDDEILLYKKQYLETVESMLCKRCRTRTTDLAVKRYDPCFDHKHVTFLPQHYLHSIRHGKPGEYLLYDEPGAESSARRFMTIRNQLLNKTIITFRSLKISTGWAVPILNLQDITANRLVNYLFVMSPNEPGSARFYSSWTNPRTAQTGALQIGWVHFSPPFQDRPEELKEYLELKKQYQDSSYDKYYKEFEQMEKKESGEEEEEEKVDIEAIVKEILASPDDYKTPKGLISEEMVKFYHEDKGLKVHDVKVIKTLVEREMRKNRLTDLNK